MAIMDVNRIMLKLRTFEKTKIEVLKCNITTSKLSNDGVHLNLAGVQNIVKSIWNYYQQHNITVSQNNIALQETQQF